MRERSWKEKDIRKKDRERGSTWREKRGCRGMEERVEEEGEEGVDGVGRGEMIGDGSTLCRLHKDLGISI